MIRRAIATRVPEQRHAVGHVEKGFIEGQPLNERRHLVEDGEYLAGYFLVTCHARPDADRMRAQPQGRAHGHGRVHAELSNFVAGGRYDSAAVDSADDDRLAGGLGIVALFNRCIERIHVNMKNSAMTGPHASTWLQ